MGSLVDTNWQYRGLQVVRIENEYIRIDVFPEVGAKMYNFVHKASNKNLLWHNPRVPLGVVTYGNLFDDHWSGGWDELIPNDVPFKTLSGEMLPDHGEVWSQESEWDILEESEDVVAVRFVTNGRILPTRFEKTISLRADESFCSVRYAYINLGAAPIDFLWNICCAFEISPATRLDIPARRGIIEATDPWNTLKFNPGTEYEWPCVTTPAGDHVDFRTMPPAQAGVTDFQYLPNVSSGWFAHSLDRSEAGADSIWSAWSPRLAIPTTWRSRRRPGMWDISRLAQPWKRRSKRLHMEGWKPSNGSTLMDRWSPCNEFAVPLVPVVLLLLMKTLFGRLQRY
jgi:hypothetical protein